jgi:nucleoside-diphosphate-sugar epimerase
LTGVVLVTGGSGFIASHCIAQLLRASYEVRTTVRSLKREDAVRAMLKYGGAERADSVRVIAADLENDSGWTDAAAGCNYVLHVASPFPAKMPRNEDELIVPAREGALRVLRASRDAGVKRVVLTSSFAAIGYGHPQQSSFDETTWTNLDTPRLAPYPKSKTLAERAAWDFIAGDASGMELSVINPVAVFGPVLGADFSTSIHLVRRLLSGRVRAVPRLWFGIVDVRDVADLHLRAMTDPAARGERFLAVAGEFLSILEMAKLMKSHLGDAGRKLPTRQLPDWMVRLAALRDPEVRQVLSELGKVKTATAAKARRLLGWAPRSSEEALLATAHSLQHFA